MVTFSELPAYMKPSLVRISAWPIPEPHPDQIVVSFLARFDVEVTPAALPGFDGADLVVGFLAGFGYAQLNSINKNQAKQALHMEWTTWKQWAIAHNEFSGYKEAVLNGIREENKSRLEWLNSETGLSFIEDLRTKHDEQVRKSILLAIGTTASVSAILAIATAINLGIRTTDAITDGIRSSMKPAISDLPEPKGFTEERYQWLAAKCNQSKNDKAVSYQGRNFCNDRDGLIKILLSKGIHIKE